MPPKKKADSPINSNTNNNSNVVNVNVKTPRAPRKKTTSKKQEPNWILKATVIALIGAAVSFLVYQIQKEADGGERPKPGSLGPVTRDN